MPPCCKQTLFCRAEESPDNLGYPETRFSKNGEFAAINGEHTHNLRRKCIGVWLGLKWSYNKEGKILTNNVKLPVKNYF